MTVLRRTLRLNPRERGSRVDTSVTPANGGVELELRLAYEPPAAALGNFVAGRVESLVKGRLEAALERIRAELEESR